MIEIKLRYKEIHNPETKECNLIGELIFFVSCIHKDKIHKESVKEELVRLTHREIYGDIEDKVLELRDTLIGEGKTFAVSLCEELIQMLEYKDE